MEYIDGDELFDRISKQENQVFNEKLASQYMHKILSALNHMHSQGIVHRDIKPENIMFNKNNEIKLIDFGLAQR